MLVFFFKHSWGMLVLFSFYKEGLRMSSNDSHQGRVGDSRTVRLRPGFVDRKDFSGVRQQIADGSYDSDGNKFRVALDAMLAQVQHRAGRRSEGRGV